MNKNDIVTFWKTSDKYGEFSQWHKSMMFKDDKIYETCEHYMMYHKALLFNDTKIADKILKYTDPHEVKKLGRKIKNFDEYIWSNNREKIVYDGNLMKFTHNDIFKNLLLSTGDAYIAEASPYDKVWGTNLDERKTIEYYRKNKEFPGLNLLGIQLMKVRKTIRDKILTDTK